MRILTIIHTRWSSSLGGPRPQLELSVEWEKLGHVCEKYSYEDAFPDGRQRRARFADRAAAFVRANARRFDVIDCHQTDIPFSKSELGFKGLLVARSVGLMPLYAEVLARQDRRDLLSVWGPRLVARHIRRLPDLPRRAMAAAARRREVEASFRHADLINVANRDDLAYIASHYGLGEKCVVLPFGLADDTRSASAAGPSPLQRRADREVVFVGNWEPRKGARDWWKIVRRVKSRVPEARFRFLGTTAGRDYILWALGIADVPWVEVVTQYENSELPRLLMRGTVAAFPSYVEGFGFGVLETLAAGIPTVAYDAPGPREMLGPDRLVPLGDKVSMGDQLVAILTACPSEYEAASAAASAAVAHLRWPAIARETALIYQARLDTLRTGRK